MIFVGLGTGTRKSKVTVDLLCRSHLALEPRREEQHDPLRWRNVCVARMAGAAQRASKLAAALINTRTDFRVTVRMDERQVTEHACSSSPKSADWAAAR